MKIQATIRWSTWGAQEHGHGYRSTWVEKIPQHFNLEDGKLRPVYDGDAPENDSLLALIGVVEDGIENVRKNGAPGFNETWYNREMFEIKFLGIPEKGEVIESQDRPHKSFWASEGWKEHKYD